MANVVLIGAQWGDEGKAKITDLLSEHADIIIRYQGGSNAGHTVVANGETYKFHLIPSGILYRGKLCIIGAGTVVSPEVLIEEIEDLKSKNIDTSNLFISSSAHITMPYHIDLDGANEKLLGDNKIGTTNRGIGPTYADKISRIGIRAEDLLCEEALAEKLEYILPQKNLILEKVYGLKTYSKEEMMILCKKYADYLAPYIVNTSAVISKAIKQQKRILFEGAQGTMLDIDHGTYPFVTSSSPIAGGACLGAGVGPTFIDEVIGISKAYATRVGEGPFISELNDEMGDRLQEVGQEFGTTTGRTRRCGWFDAVAVRYSALVNGLTCLALTKIDVFNDFEEIKICTSYRDNRNGEIHYDYPTSTYLQKYLEPVYETMPGWNQDISGVKDYDSLPENAKKYVARIEELTGVSIAIVSVGAEREQTIMLKNPLLEPKKEILINF